MLKSISEERWIDIVFGLICTLAVLVYSSIKGQDLLNDGDTSWHIRSGHDIIQTGMFPVTDQYSFTQFGEPWIAKEWLAQIIYYLAYAADGWAAVSLVAIAIMSLTAWLLYMELSKHLAPRYAATLAPLLILLVSPTILARPHLLILPIAIIWTSRLFARARQGQPPEFWLLVLMVLWSNLNASFLLGYVIAAFGFLHVLWASRLTNMRLVVTWLIFLALCPVASTLTPYGWEPLIIAVKMAVTGNPWLDVVSEWAPFSYKTFFPVSLALFALLWALMVFRPRFGLVTALFIVFCFYAFMMHARFIYFFFLLMPLAVIPYLAEQYPKISRQTWLKSPRDAVERTASSNASKIILLFLVVVLVDVTIVLKSDVKPHESRFPITAIEFAKNEQISGNVLNHYDFGGPLILSGIRTFVDGRADQIFLGDFHTELVESVSADGGSTFRRLIDRYDISWSLLDPRDVRNVFLAHLPGWHEAYRDTYSVIYRRSRAPTHNP